MIALIILKYLFLAIGIVYTTKVAIKALRGSTIYHIELVLMAIGLAGYFALMNGFKI